MTNIVSLRIGLIVGTVLALAVTAAVGRDLSVPGGDLDRALKSYIAQTGVQLVFSTSAVKGVQTKGAISSSSDDDALAKILSGTGFVARRDEGIITIVRGEQRSDDAPVMHIAMRGRAHRWRHFARNRDRHLIENWR